MADRPMLFSAPMVRAILHESDAPGSGKTQTRRVLKPQPDFRGGAGDYYDAEEWGWEDEEGHHISVLEIAPNGLRRGDRLWVREAHAILPASAYRCSAGVLQTVSANDRALAAVYRCGWERCAPRWRPSTHMPRWASRITLTVTDVLAQRLQDIGEADARAEGVARESDGWRGSFATLWDSLNAKRGFGWDSNPWVCAISFTPRLGNIDSEAAP